MAGPASPCGPKSASATPLEVPVSRGACSAAPYRKTVSIWLEKSKGKTDPSSHPRWVHPSDVPCEYASHAGRLRCKFCIKAC